MRAIAAAALLVPALAGAVEYGLKLEPGMALAVTQPQSNLYGAGGGVAVKGAAGFGLVDLQATVALLGVGAVAPDQPTGFAFALGGGARLQRPHRGNGRFFPWVDADALYVRTGPLDRFGFAVAAGCHFGLGAARMIWIGPFLRYLQILQPDHAGLDNHDAKIVMVGIAGELGRAHPIEAPQPKAHVPAGVRVKVYFARDASAIGPKSAPLLDEVAAELRARPSLRLRVDGHADSNETHPEALSLERAEAVKRWLVELGIAASRLEPHGAGAPAPDAESRERDGDRRVDFTVLDGSDQ